MSSVDDVIVQNVTISDKAPTRPGFGTPLLVGYHTRWVDKVHAVYSDTDEMLDDGFTTDDDLYKAALILKSQENSPRRFIVGRRAVALTQIIHLTPTITTEGHVYRWTIDGNEGSYTVPGAATVQSIVEAIQPVMDAYTGVICTEDNTKLVVTSSVAGVVRAFDMGDPGKSGWLVLDSTADTTTDDTLAAIDAELDGTGTDYYGTVVVDSHSKATGLLVAAHAEANKKLCVFQSPDSVCHDSGSTTDIMASLETSAYNRTGCLFHAKIGGSEWAAVGWMAARFAQDPGVETWAFKTISGVSTTKLTGAQKSNIDAKNGNVYVVSHGLPITYEGKAGSGRYFDTTRFVDWQTSTIEFDLFALLQGNPKVPYTNAGISAVKGTVEVSIQKGQRAGGVADEPAPTVTTPTLSETDTSDRALRILRDVDYTYRLTGALHSVVVTGNVSV